MRSSTPTALKQNQQKERICLIGEGRYILFCVSEFCAMCVDSIPSKDVYVFFILRRRVQRYCTAVRDGKNKKHIHRRHKSLCVQNKMYCPELLCNLFKRLDYLSHIKMDSPFAAEPRDNVRLGNRGGTGPDL